MKERRFTFAGIGALGIAALFLAGSSCANDEPARVVLVAETDATTSPLVFVTTPCGTCIADRCAASRAACDHDPACALRLRCVEACPLDASGSLDPTCVGRCPAAAGSVPASLATAYDDCRDHGAGLECLACAGRVAEPPIDPPPWAGACPPVQSDAGACDACQRSACCGPLATYRAAPGRPGYLTCSDACDPADGLCDPRCMVSAGSDLVAKYSDLLHCVTYACTLECTNGDACTSCMRSQCPHEIVQELSFPEQLETIDACSSGLDAGSTCNDFYARDRAYRICKAARCASACAN